MPLTLVPTPIGNLEDITLRALRVLREADLIACEDTRTSRILLQKYNIDRPLTSFHVHNENEKIFFLLEKLRAGEKIAVISDAGTPGISDPGWILLRRAIDENIPVDVLPGASAIIPAVLLSGINPKHFAFFGFPPEKSSERKKFFEGVKNFECALCFYISPHKAEKNISDMIEIFGERNSALVREISKVFQEVIRGTLREILSRIIQGVKGELVLIIEGRQEKEGENFSWRPEVQSMKENGASVKDIVKEIAEKYSVPKNEIKKYIMTHIKNF